MIGQVRRKLLVPALKERQFWVLLGTKALAWRRFVRELADRPFFGPEEDAPTTSEPPQEAGRRSRRTRKPVHVGA